MNTKQATIELRKITRGGAFILLGTDDRYIRGPYCRDGKTFLCQHPASMTHHHFVADALVVRA